MSSHHIYIFLSCSLDHRSTTSFSSPQTQTQNRREKREREYRTNCADETIRGCFCDERNDIALLFPLPLPPTQHKTQHNTTQHRTERKKNDTATTTTTPPFRQYQQLYVTTI